MIEKCMDVVEKYIDDIEEKLSINGTTIRISSDVLKEHMLLGNPEHLEGMICSNTKIITLYPNNIYYNHCAIPEPYNWIDFEGNVVRVLAHEMRRLWQLENGLFFLDNAEGDADIFAAQYMNNVLYHNNLMLIQEDADERIQTM